MDPYQLIERNLARCRNAMEAAARRKGRDPAEVKLLPVTKYVGPDAVRLLYQAGLRDFAESRVERGVTLAREIGDLHGVRWHLVGHLQRNKVRRALETFHSIHSLDSVRLAEEIASAAAGRPLPALYVEINVAREPQKTGMLEEDLDAFLEHLRRLGTFPLAGLMAMPPHNPDPEASRPYFRRLRELRDDRAHRGLLPPGAGLSMGMSADFAVAVEEGATVIRIGSLLFEDISKHSPREEEPPRR